MLAVVGAALGRKNAYPGRCQRTVSFRVGSPRKHGTRMSVQVVKKADNTTDTFNCCYCETSTSLDRVGGTPGYVIFPGALVSGCCGGGTSKLRNNRDMGLRCVSPSKISRNAMFPGKMGVK